MDELKFIDQFTVVKESMNIILQLFAAFLQIYGFFFVVQALNHTAKQIEISEKTHSDTLEWNKKKATDEVLEIKPDREVTKRLNKIFQTLNSKEPIRDYDKKIAEFNNHADNHADNDDDIELDIHHLLNLYERLARGINNKIYVEEMIKDGLMNTFTKVYNNYSLYIQNRRGIGNPNAWSAFEKYVNKWKSEE